ncbi:SusC/RagA family TonB-linked outer membrane protein [Chitinophagaceae bacterium LWZ2-11]
MTRLIKRGIGLLLLLSITNIIYAQEVISGKVVSENNQPLEGVTVYARGRTVGTTTAKDGSFRLELKVPSKAILISFVGYEEKEINISAKTSVTIVLKKDNKAFEDVVVTGYSTQNKKFISGAISSVSGNAIKDVPAAGFNQILQGKSAGVQITSNSGVPGGSVFIRIRGTNSINAGNDPLYVIDGVFVNSSNLITTGLGNQLQSNPLADINPSDIENIQILKDANATAIYGSLGANGVILVTTKHGKLNSKTKVNVNAYHGWATAAKKFEVTTGPQTALLTNEYTLNTAIDKGLDPSTITLPFANPDTLPTYDRIKDLFRTAQTSNYELSVSGGTAKNNFYLGLGYFKQESIIKPSAFDRYSVRFNFDNYVTDKFKVGINTNIVRTWRNVSSNDNNPVGVINSALFPRSYLPIYNADGTYAKYGSFDNHIALINNLNNNAVGWRTTGTLYGEYAILPGLKLRSNWSIDYNDMYENNYNNTAILAGQPAGNASSIASKYTILQNEQVLTYIKTFAGKHNINALIGNTIQQTYFERTSLTGSGFPNNSFTTISAAATQNGSSSNSLSRLVSFFAKAGYTYDNKYSIDGSIRADASSRFGVNHRWAYFPSAGITWRAGQEDFIKATNIFNELKVRASLGWSGNQAGIGDYSSLGLWSAGNNYLDQPGTAPTQLANPNLTWETTRQLDIGLEFSVLKNRLTVSLDYYDKYTYNLLQNVPVPTRSGYASITANYGSVSNKGFEVSINSVNINTKDFRWVTDFNISTNKNKVVSLPSPVNAGSRNIVLIQQGSPLYSFWLFKQLEVDPKTGNAVYQDVNNDGKITLADRQIVGNAWPDYTGGLNNTLTYKDFDFGFNFYFQHGNKIMNMNRFFLVHGGTQSNIGFIPEQLKRWQKQGDITDIPRMTTYSGNIDQNNSPANNYGGNVQNLSSRYLEDGSFIRLKTVSLGYTIPSILTRKWGLNSVRAYVQAANLWTITKYSGLDPEVNSQSSSQNTPGFDWATVPQPRTLQVGLNVTF